MKRTTVLLLCFFTGNVVFAQSPDSLYVSGRFLYNHCNQKIILRGINYSVLDDWDFPANMNNGAERSSEIEKTGANCMRIQWYNNYGQPSRPAYTLANLDSILTRCKRYNIIPIVGLWDMTCSNDWANFTSTITNWWTQPAVLALIQKHKRYMILNVANEFGYYQWTGNAATALNTFKTNYKSAITALRNAGIKVPLMIDAPDCGQNLDAFILCGQELVAHDPLHNILLSTHAYWTGYVGNDSTTMANKIQQAVAANLPLVMGEIANYQSDNLPCEYTLNYPDLLEALKIKEVGWLAWGWYKDYCSNREMTHTGLYSQLTSYGSDLVNNAGYGLKSTAIRNTESFDVCASLLPLQSLNLQVENRNGFPFLSIAYAGTGLKEIMVEKSTDRLHWNILKTIALTNSAGKTELADNMNTGKEVYYRAIIKDAAGQVFYSAIKIFSPVLNGLSIWPNPSAGRLWAMGNKIVVIKIFDQQGRSVLVNKMDVSGLKEIDLGKLTGGFYTVQGITAGNRVYQKQLIIKR